MKEDFNKNARQINFNSIKGVVLEFIKNDIYSAVIIEAGHEMKRQVYLSISTEKLKELESYICVGMKVSVKFYIASKQKNGRWFTNVNVLSMERDLDCPN